MTSCTRTNQCSLRITAVGDTQFRVLLYDLVTKARCIRVATPRIRGKIAVCRTCARGRTASSRLWYSGRCTHLTINTSTANQRNACITNTMTQPTNGDDESADLAVIYQVMTNPLCKCSSTDTRRKYDRGVSEIWITPSVDQY